MKGKKKVLIGGDTVLDKIQVRKAIIELKKFDVRKAFREMHKLTEDDPANVAAFLLKVLTVLDWFFQHPYLFPEDYRLSTLRWAREKAAEIAEYQPSNAYAWYLLGLADYQSKNIKGAKEAFRKSIALNPGNLSIRHRIERIWALPKDELTKNKKAIKGERVDSGYYQDILRRMKKYGLNDNALRGMAEEENPQIFNDERVKSLMQAPAVPRRPAEIELEEIPAFEVVMPPERIKVASVSEQDLENAKIMKEKGNEAYKNKECQVALENYNEAAKLDPHDATFLANKAAVYVELAKYEDAAACCRIALKLAHEYGCTRSLFAKLYSRLGNCEKGQKKWKDAIKLYNTSLVIEHNPNVLKLRNLSVKRLKDERRRQRWNSEEFENEMMQAAYLADEQRYDEAISTYSDAEICLPENTKEYNKNRIRLLVQRGRAFLCMFDVRECLADALAAIEIGKMNADSWLLKAAALECDKMFDQASNAFQTALKIRPTSEEAKRGLKRCLKASFNVRNNPKQLKLRKVYNKELQEIVQDPKIKALLNDLSLRDQDDYLRNSEIVEKIQTLVDVGIIKIRSGHSEVYPQHNLDPRNPLLVLEKNAYKETHEEEEIQEPETIVQT